MDEHLLRFDKEKTYCFIDCETENLCLSAEHNLSWQIAMIKAAGDEKLDEKDFYVKWDRELSVSAEAARITGFDRKSYLAKAIHIDEVFPTIDDWLTNCDFIVGHNILGFDFYLIRDMYLRVNKPYAHLLSKVIDTNSIARGVKGGVQFRKGEETFTEYQYKMSHKRTKGLRTSLKFLGKEFKIEHDYDNLHNALVDLELNLKIWNKLKWQMEI